MGNDQRIQEGHRPKGGTETRPTSAFHALRSRVDSVRQGTDDPELGEKGDAAGAFELRGGASQVRADPRQRDLRGVGLEDHQVSFQLFEGQAALFIETSGGETKIGRKIKGKWVIVSIRQPCIQDISLVGFLILLLIKLLRFPFHSQNHRSISSFWLQLHISVLKQRDEQFNIPPAKPRRRRL